MRIEIVWPTLALVALVFAVWIAPVRAAHRAQAAPSGFAVDMIGAVRA